MQTTFHSVNVNVRHYTVVFQKFNNTFIIQKKRSNVLHCLNVVEFKNKLLDVSRRKEMEVTSKETREIGNPKICFVILIRWIRENIRVIFFICLCNYLRHTFEWKVRMTLRLSQYCFRKISSPCRSQFYACLFVLVY